MPAYEFSVLLKVLPRADTVAVLKRIGTNLLDQGVVLQKLENLGQNNLPLRMTQDGVPYTKGHHFVYTFVGSAKIFKAVTDACKQDLDILRHGFADVYKDLKTECTLHEEMLPPAYRKSVLNLKKEGERFRKLRKKRMMHERDYTFFDIYM